jgi:hypothetical protein
MGTAGVTTNSLVGEFDPNIVDGGPATILKEANNDDPEALRRLAQTYTFQVRGETSSNNDPVTIINLDDNGVTWGNGDNLRNVTTKAWWRNVAGTKFGFIQKVDLVRGSSGGTPSLPLDEPAGQTASATYMVRVGNNATTATTPVYATAGVVITGGEAVIQLNGETAGVDLRWLCEVTIEPLKVLPVAVT